MGHTKDMHITQHRKCDITLVADEIATDCCRARVHDHAVAHGDFVCLLVERDRCCGSFTLHIDAQQVVGLDALGEFARDCFGVVARGVMDVGNLLRCATRHKRQHSCRYNKIGFSYQISSHKYDCFLYFI